MEVLKMVARVASIFLFIGGLVVCSVETVDWDRQWIVSGAGLGMLLLGAFLAWVTKEEEDAYTG